jgi:hypothetical protein
MKKIFLVAVLIVAAFFVTAHVVFAQSTNSTSTSNQAPPTVTINWQTLTEVGEAAPIALVIAFLSSLAGYLSATPPENFSLAKFLYTALISAIVGFLTLYAHWNYATVQVWLANGFITWYIWKASNIIAQFIISQFSKAATTVTAQATGPPK